MNVPSATAPIAALMRDLHKGKTMRQHVLRVRAIRENVVRGKASRSKTNDTPQTSSD